MEDILIAIIVSWLLFRLFRPVVFVHWNSNSQTERSSHSYSPQSHEGEIKITQSKNQNKGNVNETGEYVDYEDLPSGRQN